MLSNFLPAENTTRPDFAQTVLAISDLKFVGVSFDVTYGTAFCLDPACRWIATNYHVALMANPRKIAGRKIKFREFATGPNDEGATLNSALSAHPMNYARARDPALFELNDPLPNHHGATFSLDELQIGQRTARSIAKLKELSVFSVLSHTTTN